jgi:hypothetical protein
MSFRTARGEGVEARDPVGRCNAVISWQNRRATLAGNCRKGRGEIRWTATPAEKEYEYNK